jgi:hypothetical protein
MKAAVYNETGAPDVFRYENVPDPSWPPRACPRQGARRLAPRPAAGLDEPTPPN